jgi:hypothetical protein
MYRRVHAYFCPRIFDFVSPAMDITPATALGRLRRSIQIILQKSRPYLEARFEDQISDRTADISESTMDEIHRSTVASALKRIHDGAPDSQHSEELQWSVWQIAGSATLDIPPLFRLPSRIFMRQGDEEYFLHRPPAMLVAMVAVSLRGRYKWSATYMTTARARLQMMETSNAPWAQVVGAVFDYLNCSIWNNSEIEDLKQKESNLINVTRRKGLSRDESPWLLCALSELRIVWSRPRREAFLIGICLAILLGHAPRWIDTRYLDYVLLEAVITLAAMSCSPEAADRLHILTSSWEHPWLLQNARNPALFANWFEDTPSNYHQQLVSLLFLVISAFICRGPYPLAAQYLTVITARGDLALYTSALSAVASALGDNRLSATIRMLVVPHTQELTPTIRYSMLHGENVFQEELLKNYDLQLGASENPDPNFLAIVFMLSKRISSDTIEGLKNVNLELKNPWLRLAARVVARLDIPDGQGLPMGSLYDHRINNVIAALVLLRYTHGTVTQFTEFLLLESFLESRELSISSTALEYYIQTAISYPSPPAPSYCLSAAVSAAFNFILPDHLLWMGWEILDRFVDGFEVLSVEWRRAFAEGFFALSHRPLLQPRGDTESGTRESELEQILTWEYFHEENKSKMLRFDPPDHWTCPQLSPDARSDGSSTRPDRGSPVRATSAGLYFHTRDCT